MIQKSTDFFRNLPPKSCSHCGTRMEEQSECYTNECQRCRNKKNK